MVIGAVKVPAGVYFMLYLLYYEIGSFREGLKFQLSFLLQDFSIFKGHFIFYRTLKWRLENKMHSQCVKSFYISLKWTSNVMTQEA